MSTQEIFIWGFTGSVAVEIIKAFRYLQKPPGKLPAIYFQIKFYIVGILVAVAAGGLAVAHEVNTPLLALDIGIATPLILRRSI